MFKKLFTVTFVAVLLLSAFLSAQDHSVLRPDGKIIKYKGNLKNLEVQSIKGQKSGNQLVTDRYSGGNSLLLGTIDTLRYPGLTTSNFGIFGQEWLLQWFVAPADLNLMQVAFACYENADAMTVEVKVVKGNWSLEKFKNAKTQKIWGYYEATGNGYNDITAFLDNPDITGGWTALQSDTTEPFGNDLWSDGGAGFPIQPVGNNPAVYQWIDLSILGYPQLLAGDIFAVAIKHAGPTFDINRIGFWAGAQSGFPGWKFYANGNANLPPDNDWGWWSREFTFDMAAEVELTGDRAPVINSYTTLPSGLDIGPYTVDANITDDNPGNPDSAGVASAYLFWSIDAGTTWDSVAMTGTEPDFSGVISAQVPGTTVEYYLTATDLSNLTSVSATSSFYVFTPSGAPTLLVFNGFTAISGYPQSYYFGKDYPAAINVTTFSRDRWAYGPLVPEVVNSYKNIIEICSNGPNDINSSVIRTWLEGDATRNYMLAGDEWIGSQTGWVNRTYTAGDFQFDILGINADHNDVNYGATGDQNLPSVVYPQTGSALGSAVYDLFNQVSTDSSWTLPMHYDPYYEIGVTNWMDGVDFEADVEVFMKGLGVDTVEYNIGGNRTLPAGNKIAFFAYDPLSLDSYDGGDLYFWYGFTNEAPQVKVLEWFGIITDVKPVDNLIPSNFNLTQNFPNPFNPNTTIRFALPQTSNVVLKVYDVLGSEVATLINGEKLAGNYEVNFDASKLASGLYIYTLNAGNFTSSKKMMLMK